MKIFFDMDGVLADFDAASRNALQTDNPYKWEFVHGTAAFWDILDDDPHFWEDIPVLPGAVDLVEFAKTLSSDISILTALPRKDQNKVIEAKWSWITKNIGTLPVITCLTDEKRNYAGPGSVLIDDRNIQKKPWEANGGTFILHESNIKTKKELRIAKNLFDWQSSKSKGPRDSEYPTLNTV